MKRDGTRCTAFVAVHPLLKIAVVVVLITAAALFLHPAPSLAVILVFVLHLVWCPGLLSPALPAIGFAAAGFFGFSVVNLLGYGGPETVTYRLGLLDVSREAIRFSLSIFLRILASVCTAAWLTRSLRPSHLSSAIDGVAGRATSAALAILVIHRVMPEVARRFGIVRSMRQVRGERFGVGRLVQGIAGVLSTTIQRAELLATAVKSRGYSLGMQRTAFRPAHLGAGHLVWALSVLFLAGGLVLAWEVSLGLDGFLAGTAEQASGTDTIGPAVRGGDR